MNEVAGPKWIGRLVMDVSGGESKVQCLLYRNLEC